MTSEAVGGQKITENLEKVALTSLTSEAVGGRKIHSLVN